MKKHLLKAVTVVSLAAVALAFALPVRAADKPKAGDKPERIKYQQFTGVIDAVDAAANTVAVKSKMATKTFKATDKTTITAGEKKDATLADLKAGEKALVTYKDDAGTLVATKITMIAAKKK